MKSRVRLVITGVLLMGVSLSGCAQDSFRILSKQEPQKDIKDDGDGDDDDGGKQICEDAPLPETGLQVQVALSPLKAVKKKVLKKSTDILHPTSNRLLEPTAEIVEVMSPSSNLLDYWTYDSATGEYVAVRPLKDSDFVLDEIFVSNRSNFGFPMADGEPIRLPNSTILQTYFSLKIEGVLRLPASEAGYYSVAVISDDGVVVDFDRESGFERLIDAPGVYPERMNCAAPAVLHFDGTNEVGMRILYLQGPANHLSLNLIMKKLTDEEVAAYQAGDDSADVFCGTGGVDNFFVTQADGSASVPSNRWLELEDRNWFVVPSAYLFQSYQLPPICREE